MEPPEPTEPRNRAGGVWRRVRFGWMLAPLGIYAVSRLVQLWLLDWMMRPGAGAPVGASLYIGPDDRGVRISGRWRELRRFLQNALSAVEQAEAKQRTAEHYAGMAAQAAAEADGYKQARGVVDLGGVSAEQVLRDA